MVETQYQQRRAVDSHTNLVEALGWRDLSFTPRGVPVVADTTLVGGGERAHRKKFLCALSFILSDRFDTEMLVRILYTHKFVIMLSH